MAGPTAARDPEIAGVFRRPFPEQLALWRAKMRRRIPTETWRDLMREAHDRAFVVAGAMKAELLADLAAAVDAAIADGEGIESFRRRFDEIVARHGWDYRGERNWRTRVIYGTNAATSYAAGRLAQLKAGGLGWWMYKHSDSVLHPRPLHVAWDGLVLPADHPWWQSHYPPNGWGCKCRVVGLERPEDARALGGDPDKPIDPAWRRIDPRTGAPVGIDEGWDYQPGASRADLVQRITARARRMPDQIGSALLADLAAGRAVWQAVREAEADVLAAGRAAADETEYLALVDERGERVLWRAGGTRRVTVTPSELAPGIVAVHNHPGSTSLSFQDLRMAATAGLARVIAVGHDGTRYAARVLDAAQLEDAWTKAMRAALAVLVRLEGRVPEAELTRWEQHAINLGLARAGLIAYTVRGMAIPPAWVDEVAAAIVETLR